MKNVYIVFVLISFLSACSTINVPINALSQSDNPESSVPPIVYHSAFLGYQPQRPLKLQSWSKANESVKSQSMDHMQHMNMPMPDSQEKPMNMDQKMGSPATSRHH